MSASLEELSNRASDLFDPDLAKQVVQGMERDAASEPTGQPALESVATFFLGDRFYNRLPTGRIEGRINVVWNGPDSFVFVPDPNHPLWTGNGF
ncbi:MAG: hypothetical protein JWO08_654 [Verrucomicrobiaceae bacterium]|nr:hypothetical protein [Verrucomicrobiaceae bacterium]